MGRKTFSPELGTKICLLLAGGESLRAICKRDDMPVRSIVHEWVLGNPEFAAQYEMAQSLRADDLFDECLEIADDTSRDFITKTRPDGSTYEAPDTEHINRSRLRVDTRKWACGRMLPKKYGDRVVNEMVGEGGGPLVVKLVKYGAEDDGNPPSK